MPWDLDSPAAKFVAQLGAKKLMSGEITPAQAIQNASALGLGGQSQDSSSPLDMTSSDASSNPNPMSQIGGSGGPSPLQVSPPDFSPMTDINSNPLYNKVSFKTPGAHIQDTVTGKQEAGNKTTKNTYLSSDDIKTLSNSLMSLPQFQNQQAGIDKLSSTLDQNTDLQKNLSHMDWSPLISYADSINGTNNAKNYTAPQAPAAIANQVAVGQEALLDKKQAMAKDLLDSFTKLKSGSAQDNYYKMLTDMNTAGVVPPRMGGSGGNAQATNTFKWNSAYNGDKALQTANTGVKSGSELQQLLDANTSASDFMAKVAAMRASGLQRITNYEMSNFSGDKSAANQFNQAYDTLATGNLDPANITNMKAAAKILSDSAQKIVDGKTEYYRTLGTKTGVDTTGLLPDKASAQPSAGPHGASVTQNGHTYDWNPKTGKYE